MATRAHAEPLSAERRAAIETLLHGLTRDGETTVFENTPTFEIFDLARAVILDLLAEIDRLHARWLSDRQLTEAEIAHGKRLQDDYYRLRNDT